MFWSRATERDRNPRENWGESPKRPRNRLERKPAATMRDRSESNGLVSSGKLIHRAPKGVRERRPRTAKSCQKIEIPLYGRRPKGPTSHSNSQSAQPKALDSPTMSPIIQQSEWKHSNERVRIKRIGPRREIPGSRCGRKAESV